MRYPKYLINAFAILGIASFIFLACSAGETAMDNEDPIENGGDNDGDNGDGGDNDGDNGDGGDGGDNNPPIQNNYGKYQISTSGYFSNDIYVYTTILNTETGQVSLYSSKDSQSYVYQLLRTENIGN